VQLPYILFHMYPAQQTSLFRLTLVKKCIKIKSNKPCLVSIIYGEAESLVWSTTIFIFSFRYRRLRKDKIECEVLGRILDNGVKKTLNGIKNLCNLQSWYDKAIIWWTKRCIQLFLNDPWSHHDIYYVVLWHCILRTKSTKNLI
jgi:hypothetical protein